MPGGSDEGARLLQVVHAEGHLRVSTNAAQMDQAHDVDPRIAEAAGEARQRARPVVEADVKEATANVRELEAGVRAREMRVDALRDYAVALQRAFRTANGKPDVSDGGEENPPPPDVSAPPP